MAKDESALGGGTTPSAPPPTETRQTYTNTTPSPPSNVPNLQAPEPSYCSHEDNAGVPYDLITGTLSFHFNSVWRSHYEPKEDDYDSDIENDCPLRYDRFEPAFCLGDIVRVQSDKKTAWAKYMPGLDGYYSKQVFKIIGRSLKAGSWWKKEMDERETKVRARYLGDDGQTYMEANEMGSHLLSLLCADGPEPGSDDECETETAEEETSEDGTPEDETAEGETAEGETAKEDSWENDCWMYNLEPVEPPRGFPMADVMLWKEENLIFDAEAMDVDDDDDDDDDHSDN